MSSALLSRRLKELEFAGIVERRKAPAGRGSQYHLTEAGKELFPIVLGMGGWAQRWLRNDLTQAENLDPDLLMWDVRRSVTRDGLPADRRFVVLFQFSDMPANRRRYWLVFEPNDVDLCIKDPGYEVDLYVSSHLRSLVEIWLGHLSIAEALQLDGAPKDAKAFTAWFALSIHAKAGREAPAR